MIKIMIVTIKIMTVQVFDCCNVKILLFFMFSVTILILNFYTLLA